MTEQAETTQTKVNRRTMRGVIVSAKMQNTVTVAVDRYVKHPKYHKYQRRTKKYLVHDAAGTAQVGQAVTIQESNPISKRKRFTLVNN